MHKTAFILFFFFLYISCGFNKINRKAVISRHNIHINEIDTLNSLSLGNGRFAMTMDITGLQTFPLYYKKGVPLGTMSEWGWHSFPPDKNYTIEQTLKPLASHGRKIPYAVHGWPENTEAAKAADYIRQNPHRIHLASIGLNISKQDGTDILISDMKKIDQKLDVLKGELISNFEIDGSTVKVITIISQTDDVLGVKIISDLISKGRLGINIKFPYPTGQFLDEAALFDTLECKRLKLESKGEKNLIISRKLDSLTYYTSLSSSLNINSTSINDGFHIIPSSKGNSWSFMCSFSDKYPKAKIENFTSLRKEANSNFNKFWKNGGIIDFGKVKDKRAAELERRMVLSIYLTKINCGGNALPQETGLTYNSWFGKPHLEMAWWHGVHFALWNRPEVLDNYMDWYLRNYKTAKKIAFRQGFKGYRWPKMTDNNGGETPSSIGSYLIWQQPHIIYFSELLYKIRKDQNTLNKYSELVEQTAEFMVDFAWHDSLKQRYILGPGVIPAQERFDPIKTFNPAFELAYWRWGLETAQKWRERLGKERNEKWDLILINLSSLPQKDSLYLATESASDSYSNNKYMTDHPSVLCAYGMLPKTKDLNISIMQNTFDKVWKDWQWKETWGWDFPLTAMTATRLGYPEKAVEALLMPVETNTYLKNGHNYQNKGLRVYLPGNGGFLTALAMMSAGTLENIGTTTGFPKTWEVKFEGLTPLP